MPVTEYTWDSVTDSILDETDGAGNVLESYTNEPSLYGPLISQRRAGETRYFHFDALGSTRELTDDTENVTDTFTYDAWGSEVQHGGTSETPFRWVGRWGYLSAASDNGLVGVRYRMLDSDVARWSSKDPLIASVPQPAYIYAMNSPAVHSDPLGLIILLGMPASPAKCGLVDYYITLTAEMLRWVTYDKILWDYYKQGSGTPLSLPMNAFDPTGSCRRQIGRQALEAIRSAVADMVVSVNSGGKCEATIVRTGSVTTGCVSPITKMINQYRMSAIWTASVTRDCIFGCCAGNTVSFEYHLRAWDITDFNPGDSFMIPYISNGESVWISDDLVIACDIGKPFTIFSSSRGGRGEAEWWSCITSPKEAELAVDFYI